MKHKCQYCGRLNELEIEDIQPIKHRYNELKRALEIVANPNDYWIVLNMKNIGVRDLAAKVLAGEKLDDILREPEALICPICGDPEQEGTMEPCSDDLLHQFDYKCTQCDAKLLKGMEK